MESAQLVTVSFQTGDSQDYIDIKDAYLYIPFLLVNQCYLRYGLSLDPLACPVLEYSPRS